MSVGRNIKKVCDQVGITNRELARLSKIPESTINTIIADKSDPKASNLKKIIIALGVSADTILFDETDMGTNGDLKILFREVERFEGKEREQLKDMLKMMIVHNKSKELMRD
ncbi:MULTISPECIES: helix-turn-helix domain-containing protein [Acinetobacter]|uniref:Helix-turn-helix transcriptional regulator n=1 Tax=Acinetobacter ursingii TaxID=108980 RepID=A0A7T9UGX3_9GAMM|nr:MULTISPECIES: helix-turn-helix transcriptional regulator [Acinetobacter]ECE6726404.1 XRE family transcriptional regulator [Salmonella enterica subsp. enterica serovar Paratyphi A]MCH2015442.1 helix-turn-helix domain-containing protein [Acinetobacter ursingii]MCU4524196.1 helix-turn-helix domain-containing protein [Acinetobacter ursingii]MCU4588171.1 helix-turn-helix domain-containing protein [Acinetobacter ursingii]MDU4394852.1 helix-turn-helix transcriptional regulator [Acinetobacter ursin